MWRPGISATCTAGHVTVSRPGQDKVSMVESRDGTRIAFDRHGPGPVIILIGGAFTDRLALAPLAQALAAPDALVPALRAFCAAT
jgi:hypothetical protein